MHYMLIDVAGLFKSLWGLEQRERKRDGKERAWTQEMQKKGALIIVKSEFQTLSSSFSWFCKQYSYMIWWVGRDCSQSVAAPGPLSLLKHVPSTSCLHTLSWPLGLYLPFLTLSNWLHHFPSPPDTFLSFSISFPCPFISL